MQKKKGMKKIEKIFSRLNKVNTDLDAAIVDNLKDEVKELQEIDAAEAALVRAKERTEARVAMAQSNRALLQEASNKASMLMNNLKTIMNTDITVYEDDDDTLIGQGAKTEEVSD